MMTTEARRAYHRAYYLANREKWGYDAARYAALSLETRQARAHRYTIKYQYGLTPAQYADMLAAQGGRCAICRDRPEGKRLHIDHDHSCCPRGSRTCGKCIRGLLCDKCNFGIGLLKDDPFILNAAAEYLRSRKVG